MVMVIPPSAVSLVSLSTVRPNNEVVTGWTTSANVADCVERIPSTVEDADIVSVELPVAVPAGTEMVRFELCPAVIWAGEQPALTPAGIPVTFMLASCVNQLVLLRFTE